MIALINTTWENRESILSRPVLKSTPHSSLLDDHSTCITRKYGEAMEVVHQTDDKNTSTINLSSMEAFSANSAIIST